MQPNGANLTGGGTGSGPLSASPSQTSNPYVPFNGQGSGAVGLVPTLMFGALVAVGGVFAML